MLWEVQPDTYDILVADCSGHTLETYLVNVVADTEVQVCIRIGWWCSKPAPLGMSYPAIFRSTPPLAPSPAKLERGSQSSEASQTR